LIRNGEIRDSDTEFPHPCLTEFIEKIYRHPFEQLSILDRAAQRPLTRVHIERRLNDLNADCSVQRVFLDGSLEDLLGEFSDRLLFDCGIDYWVATEGGFL